MELVTPTTEELRASIIAQLETSLGQSIPLFPKAFHRVLAKVLSGAFILLYKRSGVALKQQFVQHADWGELDVNGKKIRPLVEHGRMFGVGDPNVGARAEHTIQITVLNQVGMLAASAELLDVTKGVIHRTLGPVVLDAPTKQIKIRAYSDPSGSGGVGVIGNMEPGAALEFARAQANVAQVATVVSQDVIGAGDELEPAYRSRVLRRKQRPLQGGAYADYRAWAEDVEGVANVYPYSGRVPGDVELYVECTPEIEADGIAPRVLCDAVESAVRFDQNGRATRMPATVENLRVEPIERTSYDVKVIGLTPDGPALRAAIDTAVNEHMRTLEPFILGLSVEPRRDRISQAALGGVVHEIVAAANAQAAHVELRYGGQLITSHTLDEGQKAKLGAVSYEEAST